jgi:hypothetical protein
MKPGDGGVLSNTVQLLLQGYSKQNEVQRPSLQAVNENSSKNMRFILMNLFIVNLQQN